MSSTWSKSRKGALSDTQAGYRQCGRRDKELSSFHAVFRSFSRHLNSPSRRPTGLADAQHPTRGQAVGPQQTGPGSSCPQRGPGHVSPIPECSPCRFFVKPIESTTRMPPRSPEQCRHHLRTSAPSSIEHRHVPARPPTGTSAPLRHRPAGRPDLSLIHI